MQNIPRIKCLKNALCKTLVWSVSLEILFNPNESARMNVISFGTSANINSQAKDTDSYVVLTWNQDECMTV